MTSFQNCANSLTRIDHQLLFCNPPQFDDQTQAGYHPRQFWT